MNAVVLLGPPGAGKGTVAKVLVNKGFTHISTGALLREEISRETALGIEAKKLMDQGQFVSDDVVVGMIRGLMNSCAPDSKFLLDGFPRTLEQADRLDELVASEGGRLQRVVLLECPVETIVERLVGRRTCGKCGAVYHVTFNPPSQGELCDVEGCALSQRSDDTEATVRERLRVYEERTAPLISYYTSKDLITRVNANQPINDVRAEVAASLA